MGILARELIPHLIKRPLIPLVYCLTGDEDDEKAISQATIVLRGLTLRQPTIVVVRAELA